jgi:polyisoprenoid-binding protein YceI
MIRQRIAALVFVFASVSADATPYVFEARHSQGVMRWNHLGFSNPSAQFSRIEGMLDWDAADPAKSLVTATIPMSGVATGVPDLDDDFRSPAFFDFEKFPAATFTSTRIVKAAGVNHFSVSGDLALHGVTKPVTLDATINKVGTNPRSQLPTVGFEATAILKRSDFGLGRFVPQVSDEIRIALTIEAVDAAEKAKLEQAEAAKEAAEASKKAADGAKKN